MSAAFFALLSQTPVFFSCQITITIPMPQVIDKVAIIAVGKDWEFDDKFAKVTGVRKVTSDRIGEELWLRGDVSGPLNAQFESTVSLPEADDDIYLLDWRITGMHSKTNQKTLESSGIGVCKQVLPYKSGKEPS